LLPGRCPATFFVTQDDAVFNCQLFNGFSERQGIYFANEGNDISALATRETVVQTFAGRYVK
jgi:hypothetical protein